MEYKYNGKMTLDDYVQYIESNSIILTLEKYTT